MRVSLPLPVLQSVSSLMGSDVSLIRPVLVCISFRAGGEFVLHAPSWNLCSFSLVVRLVGCFSYTPRAGNYSKGHVG